MASKPALAVDNETSADANLAPSSPGPHVFVAMAAVQSDLSSIGISKDRTANAGGSFKFRGIDQVMNALAPVLSKHSLLIVPRVLSRQCDVRQTKSGSAMYFVTVEAEFALVSGVDGSIFSGRTIGEANDTGDKATNKAMSIAYKYFCFQTFCIPLEPTEDPDGTVGEETVPQRQPERQRNTPNDRARDASDFPGDRQTTSQKAAPKRPAEPDRSAALKEIEKQRDTLKERSARARIALQRSAEELPAVSAFDRVWNEKCGQIRADLETAGMKAELAMLADFYAQCRASYGRDENGHSREGEELESAI